MKEFFKVAGLDDVLELKKRFLHKDKESINITDAVRRVAASDIYSKENLPGFTRSTMDGYAVKAKSSFGASESNPALLEVKGTILMGETPDISVDILEAVKISTGGMLPVGADSVVMVEHTDVVDEGTIEVYKSVAPGQHVVFYDEDFKKDDLIIKKGTVLRPQEIGLLAAFGFNQISVSKKPVIGIISTGDEVVDINEEVSPGSVRDINSYSVSAMVENLNATPKNYGIVKDNFEDLKAVCEKALSECDMVLMSGGSSVGTRDFTIEVLSSFDKSEILVHGISLSPGKPTILADINGIPVFGLPGHVVSAMVVMNIVVTPFISHLMDSRNSEKIKIPAVLSRNVPSVSGRTDYVRVTLKFEDGVYKAVPVLGKSGLINTIVKADGLIEIDMNTEGLYKGETVFVIPL